MSRLKHETGTLPAANVQPGTPPGAASETPSRSSITFYLGETLRDRARAAYRSTSFVEEDGTWSKLIVKALLAEVERREAVHNDGDRFVGGEEPLPPGRPLSW